MLILNKLISLRVFIFKDSVISRLVIIHESFKISIERNESDIEVVEHNRFGVHHIWSFQSNCHVYISKIAVSADLVAAIFCTCTVDKNYWFFFVFCKIVWKGLNIVLHFKFDLGKTILCNFSYFCQLKEHFTPLITIGTPFHFMKIRRYHFCDGQSNINIALFVNKSLWWHRI